MSELSSSYGLCWGRTPLLVNTFPTRRHKAAASKGKKNLFLLKKLTFYGTWFLFNSRNQFFPPIPVQKYRHWHTRTTCRWEVSLSSQIVRRWLSHSQQGQKLLPALSPPPIHFHSPFSLAILELCKKYFQLITKFATTGKSWLCLVLKDERKNVF